MIVVDIETTGTNPNKHSILSIGAVDFDNPKREFFDECQAFAGAHIEEDALLINGRSIDKVFDPSKKNESDIVRDFLEWAKQARDHTFAGQNPSFDVSFILAGAERSKIDASVPKRTIDLHSICYFHMIRRGITPPIKNNRSDINSDFIMEYVGISPEKHPHIAINGARIEAEAFNRLFNEKYLYEEYKNIKIPWLQ